MITAALIGAILERYQMGPDGIHGLAHWGRVMENGVAAGGRDRRFSTKSG
jgi:hypothetical protein